MRCSSGLNDEYLAHPAPVSPTHVVTIITVRQILRFKRIVLSDYGF